MQEINSKVLINKVEEYKDNKIPLMEVEVCDIRKKLEIAYHDFSLPLSLIKKVSFFIQRIYAFFSLIEIYDKNVNIIGIQIKNNQNEIYQIASYERKEKDESITNVEQYIINNQENQTIVEVSKTVEGYENVSIISSQNDTSISKESVITTISKEIEKLFGYENDTVKIYQIRRK